MKKIALGAALLLFPLSGLAFAGPGGEIAKGLWYTPLGRFLVVLLGVLLFPLFLYVFVKERIAERRTLRDLEFVAREAPEFDWLMLRRRVQECFLQVHRAWELGDVAEAMQWMTSWYWQNQQRVVLDRWESQGLRNVCEVFKVQSIRPLLFVHRNGEALPHDGSELVVAISANMTDYLIDKATGRVVEGDRKKKDVERVWTFLLREGVWKVVHIEEGSSSMAYAELSRKLPEIGTTIQVRKEAEGKKA